MVETDCSFMAIKGSSKKNLKTGRLESSPEDVYYIIQKIAEIKKLDFGIVHKQIYETSLKFLDVTEL